MLSGSIALAKRFLIHWLNAVDQHSLQAPFIYDFYTRVIKNKPESQKLHAIQELRRNLLNEQTTLTVTDFGTGNNKPQQRTVGDLVRKSNHLKVSRLLYNIANRYKPMVIVELGTSLGLGTLHLAAAAPQSKIITFEGCPETSEKAKCNFKELGVEHIQLVTGTLDKTLGNVLSSLERIDLLFIDANHRYHTTLKYFTQCLPKIHSKSILVMDDIHWSEEMEHAWQQVLQYNDVSLTVDLFQVGVVFFDKSLSKSHHVLVW